MSDPQSAVLEGSARNEELAANGRKLCLAVHVMLKSALLYDINNRFWERPLGSMQDVVRWHFGDGVGKPLVLASIEKAIFLNGTLVRLDAGSYGAMRFVARAFDMLGIEEIGFLGPLEAEDLRPLVTVFRDAIRARTGGPLLENTIVGVRFAPPKAKDPQAEKDKMDPRLASVTAYANAAASAAEFRGLFLSGGSPILVRLKRAAQELVTTAVKYPDLLVGLTQLPRLRGTAAGHMVNSAAYALLLSRKLGLPRRSLSELAVNAMLAPLGVANREGDTLTKSAEPSKDDAAARFSAAVAMMRRYGAVARPSLVRTAIVHESAQKADAYKLGMKPHLFSRVIAVASAYDLALQDSLPDEALRRVVSQGKSGALDQDVVALLSEVMGVYPVGSTVRLTDGTLAVVVQAPRDPSKRSSPVVRILQGAGGRLLDLSQPGIKLAITATVPPETQQVNVTHCFLL
ncbi:MAG: hypothetical protein ACXVEF_26365 [Polyangiales bacterium]